MSFVKPLRDSTEYLEDTAALKTRLLCDGYLLIRQLLPRQDVLDVHILLAGRLREYGWLDKHAALADSIANPDNACVDPSNEYIEALRFFNQCFEYMSLSHHKALISLLARLLDDEILVHPKPLPRLIFPSLPDYTTPAHQDYPNIQGTEDVYTAWVPLMDCDNSTGGLQLAAGSHTEGVFDFGINNGAGGIEIKNPLTDRWVGSGMRAGDVLFFHSLIVHKGVVNQSKKLRMSMDARYQRVSDPFNPDNASTPYGLPLTWDEVYETWPNTPDARALKYYWKRLNLRLKPFDPKWFNIRDDLGFQYAEAGDRRAISVLQRIIARDHDPDKRARAEKLLDQLENNQQ